MCAALALVYTSGCEDEIPPPPEEDAAAQSKEIEIDLEHRARFSADREVSFHNCVLVWQPDPADSAASALSLTTSMAAPDGSRFIFGTFVNALTLERVMQMEVDFVSSAIFDAMGNGIFTSSAVYQPKSARLKIEKIEEGSVEGKLSGEFHHFRLARPALRPDAIKGELRFKARLMDRTGGL